MLMLLSHSIRALVPTALWARGKFLSACNAHRLSYDADVQIVAVLVGVVWGLWIGFGIVAAGTFAGEVRNNYPSD